MQLIYSAIFSSKNNSYNLFDINQIYKNEESISKLDIDILTYSFPCQDLSVQGLQKGMQIDSHTRSSLV
ncbi:DNA cytosine methyltransferase [bacterium]|nr:DNA cytosine methyltransferase [bacterium]MBO6072688.1 DNA cytosine methyltransferase [bacterium]